MNTFEQIVNFLHTEMDAAPALYGPFHIFMFCFMVLTTVILSASAKNCSDKAFRKIILISWIINVIMEIYVALIFSFENVDGTAVWDYEWYMFPFQFCSSPAYTLPFVALLKDGKARDAFIAFTGTFALFGGAAVMVYPGDVFIKVIGINIQTMLHHGMQLVLGIFVMVHERKKLTGKFFLSSIYVFAGLVITAMILNIGVYHAFQHFGINETFNMYFISPYFDCTLPVLSIFYPILPYPAFLCLYIFGFSLVAALMFYIQKLIIDAVVRRAKYKALRQDIRARL